MNRLPTTRFLLLAGFLSWCLLVSGQPVHIKKLPWQEEKIEKGLTWRQVHTDQLFDSRQHINVLEIRKNRRVDIVLAEDTLLMTSTLALRDSALAAVNGGFFDMKKGGSVTYLKKDWKRISSNASELVDQKNEILEGAFIITPNKWVEIEPARIEQYYDLSDDDRSVLITGPLLLQEGAPVALETTKFNDNRHPRTAACLTPKNRLLLVTVDGRNSEAQGMSLPELTTLLQELDCEAAINFDGGGSTTMYLRGRGEKGIVNHPSDNQQFDGKGERPVANAILIK